MYLLFKFLKLYFLKLIFGFFIFLSSKSAIIDINLSFNSYLIPITFT